MIFSELATKIRNTYTSLPALVDALVEGFTQVEGGSGGVNYSTDEQDTGLKWIDGSSIYCKTVNMGTSNNATGVSYQTAHGIESFSHIIKYEFVAYKTNQSGFMLNSIRANEKLANWVVEVSATQVTVYSGTANPGYQGYCTIYYVK